MKRNIAIVIVVMLLAPLAVWSASPYRLRGEILSEPEEVHFEYAGAKLSFYNAAKKSVQRFSVVLFLCDEDGNPPSAADSSYGKFDFDCDILPRETYEVELSLDDYIGDESETLYEIEFLYASRIEYEDGSAWTDEFGQNATIY